MHPLLSIVMPAFNGEAYIGAALESIRSQCDETIEVIVVDDGSTDLTLAIVQSFADKLPLRIVTPGRLGNWVAATNLGLHEASGLWACFLHQDDLWLPGRLQAMQSAMQGAQGLLLLHNATYINPQGEAVGAWTCPLPAGFVPSSFFIERLLVQNFIAIPSPAFLRSAAIDSGGLDEALWFSADWDLWLRLGAMAPVHFVEQTLSAFRIHAASQTAARAVGPKEWEQQLTTVFSKHFAVWPGAGGVRAHVERAGARLHRRQLRVGSRLSRRTGRLKPGIASGVAATARARPVRLVPLPEGFAHCAARRCAPQSSEAEQAYATRVSEPSWSPARAEQTLRTSRLSPLGCALLLHTEG